MAKAQHILINGGGIAGLACALALAQARLTGYATISLYDPHPPQGPTDNKHRMAAILSDHADWLAGLGEIDWADLGAAPLHAIHICDDTGPAGRSAPPCEFAAADIGQAHLAWHAPIDGLRWTLWLAALSHTDIRILTEAPDLANFDLVIAADGRKSVARAAASISHRLHDTGQTAIVGQVTHTHPHDFTSREVHRPNGPVTFVPMPDQHQSAIVFVDTHAAQAARADDPLCPALCAAAELAGLGKLTAISQTTHWPLTMLSVDRLWSGRTILTAEAAHVLHPLGAQGLNLSLTDMRYLSGLLIRQIMLGGRVDDPVHVMRAYERARRADHLLRTGGILASLDLLRHSPVTTPVRRMVLGALRQIKPLRQMVMRAGRVQ